MVCPVIASGGNHETIRKFAGVQIQKMNSEKSTEIVGCVCLEKTERSPVNIGTESSDVALHDNTTGSPVGINWPESAIN